MYTPSLWSRMATNVAHFHKPMKTPRNLHHMISARFSTKNRNFGSMARLATREFDYDYNPYIEPKYWRGSTPETIKFE